MKLEPGNFFFKCPRIHYLMHTEPPVLPCLQTLESEAEKKRAEIVDGWNCWFFKDMDAVVNIQIYIIYM